MASKFKNKRVIIDGLTFDSQKEYRRWCELIALAGAGRIRDLQRQVPFHLVAAVVLNGRKKPAMKYVADAVYYDLDDALVVEDVKSEATRKLPMYRAKKHMMKAFHDIEIKEV